MTYPYQNSRLPVDERVTDLVSRMSLAEKVRQLDIYSGHELTAGGHGVEAGALDPEKIRGVSSGLGIGCIQNRQASAEINNQIQKRVIEHSRWGIPALFSEEALHGLIWPGCTVFPQQIALAATFEPMLAYRQGRGIAVECRSLGVHETWSPVLDLARDPRWGRVEEGFGEDTFLASAMAEAMVRGLQGNSLSDDDAIIAEPKHFSGYGAPTGGLNCAPAMMGRHEHAFYCLPVFEAAIRAGAQNVMCSYNSIDGIPVAADKSLLTDVLRGDFSLPGFVRADMTAVIMLYRSHFVAQSERDAIRMGMEAGVDMQLYDFPHDVWQGQLIDLVQTGEIDEQVINQAVGRVLGVKFRLGLFEQPYTELSLASRRVHAPEQVKTAYDVARKAICLLKNDDNILPLSKKNGKIAVIGPSADTPRLGGYSTPGPCPTAVTLLEGIRRAVCDSTEVFYARGCDILGPELTPIPADWLREEHGQAGLTGSYYNGDYSQSSASCQPAQDVSSLSAALSAIDPDHVRRDSQIAFNWINTQPADKINAPLYTVRWTGHMIPSETCAGYIGFGGQDSIRLWLDGQLLIDDWQQKNLHNQERADKNRIIPFRFEANRRYHVCIEMVNDQRAAQVLFGLNRGSADQEEAVRLAAAADVVIFSGGDNDETCGENRDRTELKLPGRQQALLQQIHATGTPVILVLQNGRPLDLSWEDQHIAAILEAWFAGEQAGHAIASILFGDYNPAGRLPLSFPRHVGQLPVHYNRRPFGAVKYVEMDWEPLYPFGYGLSYSCFDYSDLKISRNRIMADESVEVSFQLTNTGSRAGEEVAQIYIHDQFSSVVRPYLELAGFTRVHLEAGEKTRMTFEIGTQQMRLLNQQFKWQVEPGFFELMIGSDSRHLPLRGSFQVIS